MNLQVPVSAKHYQEAYRCSVLVPSCVRGSNHVTLHALELNYDPKSPRFGAGPREDAPGLYVEWAIEDSGMVKGDR
jgi:sulfur dioxygenase